MKNETTRKSDIGVIPVQARPIQARRFRPDVSGLDDSGQVLFRPVLIQALMYRFRPDPIQARPVSGPTFLFQALLPLFRPRPSQARPFQACAVSGPYHFRPHCPISGPAVPVQAQTDSGQAVSGPRRFRPG